MKLDLVAENLVDWKWKDVSQCPDLKAKMAIRTEIVNPLDLPGWDDLVMAHKGSTIFHTVAWAKVLLESYGYEPTYSTVMENRDMMALIPLVNVKSLLTGRRGVSLPFTDYCDPLLTNGVEFEDIMNCLFEYGERSKWKTLEFRTENALPAKWATSSYFYGHALDISRSEESIYSDFRDSTKRNIKKADKERVVVTITQSLDAVRAFYDLNCETRRDHGLPCQPYIFFEKIYSHIISKNLGVVVLASTAGKNIAGVVCFHFGDRAIYKYGASDRDYQHFRVNNLVMWKAIQWYCRKGYRRFDFGRTERGNAGLLQFKRGWGALEYAINYYKYDFRKRAFIEDRLKVTGLHNRIFRMLPIPLLKVAGSMLYRHVG